MNYYEQFYDDLELTDPKVDDEFDARNYRQKPYSRKENDSGKNQRGNDKNRGQGQKPGRGQNRGRGENRGRGQKGERGRARGGQGHQKGGKQDYKSMNFVKAGELVPNTDTPVVIYPPDTTQSHSNPQHSSSGGKAGPSPGNEFSSTPIMQSGQADGNNFNYANPLYGYGEGSDFSTYGGPQQQPPQHLGPFNVPPPSVAQPMPGAGAMQPGPGNMPQGPGNMRQGPGNMHQGPGNMQQGPGNMRQGPGNMQQGPGNMHQGPGNMQQGPGNMHQGPGNMQQGPGNVRQGPGNLHQGPGNLHQGPGNMHQGPGNLHRGRGNMHRGPGNMHRGRGNMHQGPGNMRQGPGYDPSYHYDHSTGPYSGYENQQWGHDVNNYWAQQGSGNAYNENYNAYKDNMAGGQGQNAHGQNFQGHGQSFPHEEMDHSSASLHGPSFKKKPFKPLVFSKTSFVKSTTEFKSMDIEIPEHPHEGPGPALKAGDKRAGLGFGKPVAIIHPGPGESLDIAAQDNKFAKLVEAVKAYHMPNKNPVELLHMAVQKTKGITLDFDTSPIISTLANFQCTVLVNGVYVGKAVDSKKKTAKLKACVEAVNLLTSGKPLTVRKSSGGHYELKPKVVDVLHPAMASAEPIVSKKGYAPSQGGVITTKIKPSVSATSPFTVTEQTDSTSASADSPYIKPKIVFHTASQSLPTASTMTPLTGFVKAAADKDQSNLNQTESFPVVSVKPLRGFVKEGEPVSDCAKAKEETSVSMEQNTSGLNQRTSEPVISKLSMGFDKEKGLSTDFVKAKDVTSVSAEQITSGLSQQKTVPVVSKPLTGFVKEEKQNSASFNDKPTQAFTDFKPRNLCSTQNNLSSTQNTGKKPFTQETTSKKPKKEKNTEVRKKVIKDLSKFIILKNTHTALNNATALSQSCDFNHTSIAYEFEKTDEGFVCSVLIGTTEAGTGSGQRKEEAKDDALNATMKYLEDICYTIVVKVPVGYDANATGISKSELQGESTEEALPSSNIGNALLKKMGWIGGGIGKNGTGIAEPISASRVIGKQGLGLTDKSEKNFNEKVSKILKDFVQSGSDNELHFSSELEKEERAKIHKIAQGMHLKTVSRGKGENRFLTVSKKRNMQQLLNHVIENGGSTEKYEILPPKNPNISYDVLRRDAGSFGHMKQ